jgi:hypothetical protein
LAEDQAVQNGNGRRAAQSTRVGLFRECPSAQARPGHAAPTRRPRSLGQCAAARLNLLHTRMHDTHACTHKHEAHTLGYMHAGKNARTRAFAGRHCA